MKRVATITLLLLSGCSAQGVSAAFAPACTRDEQCDAGNICFPDGCGDPGSNIVIEVTPNARAGVHAQDIAVDSLTASFDVNAQGATSVDGEVQRTVSALNPELYTAPVTIRAAGESALIPGVLRSYQLNTVRLETGAYQLFVGAGKFTVTAVAEEKSIPAVSQRDVLAVPGQSTYVRLDFPATDAMVSIAGILVKKVIAGTPNVQVPLTQAAVDIQAFDPVTGRALSQRIPVSSGTAASTGSFVLSLLPEALELDSVSLVATPRESGSLIPTKSFLISKPLPMYPTLELGEFGDALPQLTGTVVDSMGSPVEGAAVQLEGVIGGGGTFRSAAVTTDAKGIFRVDLLANPDNGSYVVTVQPPPNSLAGILRTSVRTDTKAGQVPMLVSTSAPGVPAVLRCPNKIMVSGRLLRPDGITGAADVPFTATPIGVLDGSLLPLEPTEGVTAADGTYALALDVAKYRIDFTPLENLPRRSRVVEVRAQVDLDSGVGMKALTYNDFSLSNGRTVTGAVTVTSSGNSGTASTKAAPNARLRFFRVGPIQAQQSALLLGETVADELGHYSIVMPDVSHP